MINIVNALLLVTVFTFGDSTLLTAQVTKKMTVEEFVRLGIAHSPVLQMSLQKEQVMRAKLDQVKNQLLPSLNLSANYTRISDNVDPFSVKLGSSSPEVILNPQILNQSYNRVGLQYGLFTGFRAVNTYKAYDYLAKASQLDTERDKSDLRLQLIQAYFFHYKLLLSEKVLEANLKTLQNRLVDTKNFVAQNMALQNDVLKIELQTSSLQQQLTDLQGNISISNFNLNLLTGMPADTQIEIDYDPAVSLALDSNPVMLQQTALATRPELQSSAFRKMAADRSVEISKGNYYPVISVGANYDYNLPNQRVFPQQDAFKGTWTAGVTASYNLVNLYSTKALVQEQKANYAQTLSQEAQLTDAIKLEVHTNQINCQNAQAKIALAEQSIAQAAENQRIVKNRYDQQVATLTELLEADVLNTQAQLNLVQAKVDLAVSLARLQKSIGK